MLHSKGFGTQKFFYIPSLNSEKLILIVPSSESELGILCFVKFSRVVTIFGLNNFIGENELGLKRKIPVKFN